MSLSKIARPFALAAALTLGLSAAAVAQTSTPQTSAAPQTNTIVPLGHAGNRSGVQNEHPAKVVPLGHAGNRSGLKDEHPAKVIPFGHAGNRSVHLPQQ
jgi:hypothetical protein